MRGDYCRVGWGRWELAVADGRVSKRVGEMVDEGSRMRAVTTRARQESTQGGADGMVLEHSHSSNSLPTTFTSTAFFLASFSSHLPLRSLFVASSCCVFRRGRPETASQHRAEQSTTPIPARPATARGTLSTAPSPSLATLVSLPFTPALLHSLNTRIDLSPCCCSQYRISAFISPGVVANRAAFWRERLCLF